MAETGLKEMQELNTLREVIGHKATKKEEYKMTLQHLAWANVV